METEKAECFQVDCTCLDLFEKVTKRYYYFFDCAIIKKCIQNGILKEGDSVCICGKEQSGKTVLLTEMLADLTAVKELKGMNSKVVYFDCDLSFNYKNYETIINKKIIKYFYNSSNASNRNIFDEKKSTKHKKMLDASFSNVYYVPIFHPGHFIIILNSLKNLLKKKIHIAAIIIDSLTFWNYCKYDKMKIFSDATVPKRNNVELLDYAFTFILNLKRKYKFLLLYSKLHNENKCSEYIVNLSTYQKFNELMNTIYPNWNKSNNFSNNINSNICSIERTEEVKKKFYIPTNFDTIVKNCIFQKKDFTTNKLFVERPFLIYLIANEQNVFIHIKKKYNTINRNFILCISSDIKDIEKKKNSKFLFMVDNCTIVPL